MNRLGFNRMDRLVAFAACLGTMISFGFQLGTRAQFSRTYDWTIEIQTQDVKDRFDFAGSKFKDELSKLKVSYYKGTDKSSSEPVHYEDLWYSGHQIIGCRRFSGFGLKPGEHLVIRVKHRDSDPSAGEIQAAADAIVRLVVDAYANSNMTTAIVVPQSSINQVADGMARLNFYPAAKARPDEPVYTIMILQLYSDPPGNNVILHYGGQT